MDKQIFELKRTDKTIELIIRNIKHVEKPAQYVDGIMKIFKYDFQQPEQKIVFKREEKQFELFNIVPSEFFTDRTLFNITHTDLAIDFLLEVVPEVNEYLCLALTDINFQLKETRLTTNRIGISFYYGCLRNITNLTAIEKFAKVGGLRSAIENVSNEDFILEDSKKLRAVLKLPIAVVEWLKTQRLQGSLTEFQTICDGDDTVAFKLMTYFKTLKSKVTSFGCRDFNHFMSKLSQFIKNTELPTMKVMNYLVCQNFYWGKKIQLPMNELITLADVWNMCKSTGTKFDFPANIYRMHKNLELNNNILKYPRAEEFANAVNNYAALNFETDKYLIRTPETERDLFDEGQSLHHCVAHYRDSIIDEHKIVMFIRKKENSNQSFVTVEVDSKFDVLQIKQNFDEDVVDLEIFAFIGKWKQARGYLISGGKALAA